MKKNASLVIKLFEILGFEEDKVIEILDNFKWIWRRQEYLGDLEIKKDSGDNNIDNEKLKIKGDSKNINFKDDKISYKIIWLAMKIHSEFWEWLQETLYKKALKKLLEKEWITVKEEVKVDINIDNTQITYWKIDLLVNNEIVIELKSTKETSPSFYKQIKKYIKLWNYKYWLLINFWKQSLDFRRIDNSISKISQNPQIPIYTDYAHHPTEIKATYDAFKNNFPDKKIIWVFQPHQLFRFVSYEKDFLESLSKFDNIYIYDIYSVREEELLKELTWLDLSVEEQKKIIWENIAKKLNGKYIENFDKLLNNIKAEEWIVVVMTAWDLDYKIRQYIK